MPCLVRDRVMWPPLSCIGALVSQKTRLLECDVVESFQLQMGLSFPFLLANDLRSSLLIMRTLSFSSLVRRGYIHKVSPQLV